MSEAFGSCFDLSRASLATMDIARMGAVIAPCLLTGMPLRRLPTDSRSVLEPARLFECVGGNSVSDSKVASPCAGIPNEAYRKLVRTELDSALVLIEVLDAPNH